MPNRLAKELSPYLLQHQHNPVDWYPWGDEALRRARELQRPIFLSIGYATCHWCHVMEGDSFENEEVARFLNEQFVSIKVDREERPDIDAIYMRAVQAMNERGGWPLSIALTPDGKAFWGGTFFPRAQFLSILQQITKAWRERPTDIENTGEHLMEHLRSVENNLRQSSPINASLFREFAFAEQKNFDPLWGGFGRAPKFPPAMTLMGLMRYSLVDKDSKYISIVCETLDNMARGGIHDHVGGGFHRYSVDESWIVPHFEKMLYDNALLSLGYIEAYQWIDNQSYGLIAKSTLDYVLRELQSAAGGFYSAEDADSEKTEGKFYVWSQDELKQKLDDNSFHHVLQYFPIDAMGNFHIDKRVEAIEAAAGMKAMHHTNILHHQDKKSLSYLEDPNYHSLIRNLRQIRSTRIRPNLDDKIICSWNGLMIAALAKSYRVFGELGYLLAAERSAHFILTFMRDRDGNLYRAYRQKKSDVHGFLEDYAALIFGLIELYQASFNPYWLKSALMLQFKQDELFWDELDGLYFDSDGKDASLLLRTKELSDQATPSGNSLSALNLVKLSTLSGQVSMDKRARSILERATPSMMRYPTLFPMMTLALDLYLSPRWSLIIADPNSKDSYWPDLCPAFTPHTLFLKYDEQLLELCPSLRNKEPKDRRLFYLCRQESCSAAVDDTSKLLDLMVKGPASLDKPGTLS